MPRYKLLYKCMRCTDCHCDTHQFLSDGVFDADDIHHIMAELNTFGKSEHSFAMHECLKDSHQFGIGYLIGFWPEDGAGPQES